MRFDKIWVVAFLGERLLRASQGGLWSVELAKSTVIVKKKIIGE
jgi:hypothetical protein